MSVLIAVSVEVSQVAQTPDRKQFVEGFSLLDWKNVSFLKEQKDSGELNYSQPKVTKIRQRILSPHQLIEQTNMVLLLSKNKVFIYR